MEGVGALSYKESLKTFPFLKRLRVCGVTWQIYNIMHVTEEVDSFFHNTRICGAPNVVDSRKQILFKSVNDLNFGIYC